MKIKNYAWEFPNTSLFSFSFLLFNQIFTAPAVIPENKIIPTNTISVFIINYETHHLKNTMLRYEVISII